MRKKHTLFSHHYKDATIETAKCSRNKLKQNFWGSERPFKLRTKKREDNIVKDVKNLFRPKEKLITTQSKI